MRYKITPLEQVFHCHIVLQQNTCMICKLKGLWLVIYSGLLSYGLMFVYLEDCKDVYMSAIFPCFYINQRWK